MLFAESLQAFRKQHTYKKISSLNLRNYCHTSFQNFNFPARKGNFYEVGIYAGGNPLAPVSAIPSFEEVLGSKNEISPAIENLPID
jgi:hypothetical protein